MKPAWYYGLTPSARGGNAYFVNAEHLEKADRELLEDGSACYSNPDVVLMDLAYQAWLKGIIAGDGRVLELNDVVPTTGDQYTFVARHFSRIWCFLTLTARLAEFNNPIREIGAFVASLRIKRIDPFRKTKDWTKSIADFQSGLLASQPRVSVIIPTLNRYRYLNDVLEDLERQDYKNIEVIVVDQSDKFDRPFYEKYDLKITVLHQLEKAQWLARNTAIKRAEGDLILLFDDDSRVEPNWISSHIKCLDFFRADISSGVSLSAVGAKIPRTYSYYKWGDQLDTGNAMVRRDVFDEVGLFDKQFERQRQGDGEFGLRAYLAGFRNISNPDAARVHLKAAEGGLRELGSWDGWRPKSLFAPRPYPSVLYFTRKYFGNRAAMYHVLQSILPSVVPYRFKRSKPAMIIGSLLGMFLLPLIIVAVFRSWSRASQMLTEGPKIPRL